MRRIENQTFLLLLVAVTLAFAWVLYPFYGAVLWAIVVAVLFAPVHRRLLQSMQGRPSLSAAVTVLIVIAMVLLPLAMIATSLAQEASSLFAKMQSGEYNFGSYLQRILDALPAWATGLLERLNLTDFSSLREKLGSGLMKGGQILAPQALSVGVNTFDFVIRLGIMLYLLFFLLRDGRALADRIKEAIPLRGDQKTALFTRFADVVRATVKGGILVAMAQGMLGGIAFWFLGIHAALLWAVLMAFLSLIPAIGSALVWAPVAIYFLATGADLAGGRADPLWRDRHRTGGQSAASVPGRQRLQAAGLYRADFHAGRHRSVRPEWFCHRAADCRDVHGELGNLLGVAAYVGG